MFLRRDVWLNTADVITRATLVIHNSVFYNQTSDLGKSSAMAPVVASDAQMFFSMLLTKRIM